MNFIAKIIEFCAGFGADCASVSMLYQPKLPKDLREE